MRRRESTQQTPGGGRQLHEIKPNRSAPHRGLLQAKVSTFSSAALRHFRFWSISLICSSISRQRLLVTVMGWHRPGCGEGERSKRNTARRRAAQWEHFKHRYGHGMSRSGEGNGREAQMCMHQRSLCYTRPGQGAVKACSSRRCPADWRCSKY